MPVAYLISFQLTSRPGFRFKGLPTGPMSHAEAPTPGNLLPIAPIVFGPGSGGRTAVVSGFLLRPVPSISLEIPLRTPSFGGAKHGLGSRPNGIAEGISFLRLSKSNDMAERFARQLGEACRLGGFPTDGSSGMAIDDDSQCPRSNDMAVEE